MKVYCCDWAGGLKNLPSWWKNKEEVEITTDQLMEMFATGNNIMLCHGSEGRTILFVDHKRFTQR